MLWLLLAIIVAIGVLVWATYQVMEGWGLKEVPPAGGGLTPLIIAAVGTSAHTVHLTVQKGVGPVQVELERTQPPNTTKYSFFTVLNEVDDINLARDTLYRYRTRYTTPPSSWSGFKMPKLWRSTTRSAARRS
jgi:hypothetical protein